MMLRGMGFDNNTSIYVAAGKIYKAEKYMAPLKQIFPRLQTKETLASPEELAPFMVYLKYVYIYIHMWFVHIPNSSSSSSSSNYELTLENCRGIHLGWLLLIIQFVCTAKFLLQPKAVIFHIS